VYREPLTHLFRTKDNVRLVTAVARPPSWRERIEADVPYFLRPNEFYWDSRLRHWTAGDPAFDPRGDANLGGQEIQLFVAPRAEAGDGYYAFVGAGKVDAFTLPYGGEERLMVCSVEPKLPKELWMRFGGYGGWLMTVGEQEFEVRGYADAASQWRPGSDLFLTRYDGDELHAFVNEKDEAAISYRKDIASGQIFSGRYDSNEEGAITFPWGRGEEITFSRSEVISRAAALQIIRSLLDMGVPAGLRET
jgi:hypothetical protein